MTDTLYRIICILAAAVQFGVACSHENTSAVSSITVEADEITAFSAVLKGKAILGSSMSSDLIVGFQYSKSAGILPSNSIMVEATDADAQYNYTAKVTGLEPATIYYFRSFARQNGLDTYGKTKSFATKEKTVMVESVSLDKINIPLFEGGKENISVSVLPNNASNKSVTWSSSSGAIVSVDQNGNVTAKSKGTAIVSAIANDGSGKHASCSVSVYRIDTPAAVDLGIIVNGKSIKWASCNLGASLPEEYGVYCAWGEGAPKSDYSWSTYMWCNGSYSTLTKYNSSSQYGTMDSKTQLELSDDVVRRTLGAKWRMPTDEEWTALRTKCTWTWTTRNGVNGRLVTAGNGKSIFLPAAGYRSDAYLCDPESYGVYWSSSIDIDYPYKALYVFFDPRNVSRYSNYRCGGRSIRPVCE